MTEQHGPSPEFAAGYRAMLLEGLKKEMELTKKVIGAIPDAKSSYKPDANARTAFELAWHLANTDVQFMDGIGALNFAMENPNKKPTSIAEIVSWYDERMKKGMNKIEGMSSEQLTTPLPFMGMSNFPAIFYLGFLNNHSIHHRGELSTYLRPMGSKVPAIYGGSFDEPMKPPTKAADETAA